MAEILEPAKPDELWTGDLSLPTVEPIPAEPKQIAPSPTEGNGLAEASLY